MLIDCHMHTPLCGHATGEPIDFVQSAAMQGVELITFTCHIPLDRDGFGGERMRMRRDQLDEYNELIAKAQRYGQRCGVHVLRGIEAEIFPEPYIYEQIDETLAAGQFDFVLGSLHHHMPAFQDWLARSGISDDLEIIEAYFKTLTQAATSGRYHSLAHLDVIRVYGTIHSRNYDPLNHEPTIRKLLHTMFENDVCMEINTSGLTKGVYEIQPDPVIIDWAREIGVRVTIGSDAHKPEAVSQMFSEVLPMLRKKGYSRLQFFEGGKRKSTPIRFTRAPFTPPTIERWAKKRTFAQSKAQC